MKVIVAIFGLLAWQVTADSNRVQATAINDLIAQHQLVSLEVHVSQR